MWLHIINNSIFTEGLIQMFESVASEQHVYGIYGPDVRDVSARCIAVRDEKEFVRLLKSRTDWRGVIFNPLPPGCWHWLRHIPKPLRVVWFGWGYDFYGAWPPLVDKYLFLPKTKAWAYRRLRFFRYLIRLGRYPLRYYQRTRYLGRVDFFVSQWKEELDFLKAVRFLPAKTEYQFGVVGTMYSCRNAPRDIQLGRDILLGNSATPTNNHMEAIDLLSSLNLQGRKVIVPLSYGDPEYRAMIIDYGHTVLGDAFEPVTEFLPRADYEKLLSRCGYMIMNSLRQQAVGNIMMMLLSGAKVFLIENYVYAALRKQGVHLGKISDISKDAPFLPLSPIQIETNRKILFSKLGDDSVLAQLREFLG